MANRYKNLIYSSAEYTHLYRNFRGVELNASAITDSQSRLAYSQNMYKDYDGDGADVIESIPGFRCFAHYGRNIHALYYQRSNSGEDHIIVHVGTELIRHPVSDIYLKDAKGVKIANVEDADSFGFEYGRHFYIMDTQKILQISDDGRYETIHVEGSTPYVPTIYVSGEPYEQRNLLTDKFKEEFYVVDPKAFFYKTRELKFSITDPNLRYCAVSGIGETLDSEVYVPAYVDIGGVNHKVIEIADRAFRYNEKIKAIYLPEGMIKIGKNAFEGCTSLRTVATPSTLERIESEAFLKCSSLSTLYVGAGLQYVGEGAITDCSSLTHVQYALGPDTLYKIESSSVLLEKYISYNSVYEAVKLEFPFHEKVHGVSSLKVDGKEVSWMPVLIDEHFVSLTTVLPSLAEATGIKVTLAGEMVPLDDSWCADMNPVTPAKSYLAIVNCRLAEVFDGRIFFSGNPNFPNTVFYTERVRKGEDAALYVGRYNYFNDGIGSYRVKSMLAVRDMLAVFKEGDDGSGSIFYHKKESLASDGIDTIYPVAYSHSGICAKGSAKSFLDDPVFLSTEGLMALNSENINYQRNVVCRSHNVNHHLLKEDLSKASLCEWLGYLVIGINGKVFMADSRSVFIHSTGSREYEWFLLSDIGAYNGDKCVYRYSPDPYSDAIAHPTLTGEAVEHSSVYSKTDDEGTVYYYVTEGDEKYRVVPTDELYGGEFSPAEKFISHGKLLIFATADGHLCVFNNDMRGVAPKSVTDRRDYDEAEYLEQMGDKLHPLYYSFAGHTPKYVIKTSLDDCGVPHLTKSTVKRSLTVKAYSTKGGAIVCEVKADNGAPVYVGAFPDVGNDFSDLDFSYSPWYVNRYASVSLPENEKRWIEKQIILTSQCFASPISVYSISYRYTIKGKIKNNA